MKEMNREMLYKQMEDLKEKGRIKELFELVENELLSITNMSCTLPCYQVLKAISFEQIPSTLSKLIVAWLAFLNGDNNYAYGNMKKLEEEEMTNKQLKAFYYSLQALMTFNTEAKKKLALAKLSVDILPPEESSLFMANAKLTYGQMLAGFLRYREATRLFDEAYRMFFNLGLDFPASVALTNKLLNLYYLGDMRRVIEESNQILIQIGDMSERDKGYWDIIYLPLGMCYFQMGKLKLACKYLKLAKTCIEHTQMLHMQGVVEPFLMKAYYLLDEQRHMQEVMSDLLARLGHMHYIYRELFQCLYYVLTEDTTYTNKEEIEAMIERLEMEFTKNHYQGQYQVVELLLLLQQKGLSHIITIPYLLDMLKKVRFTGMRTQLQELLIFLAEINLKANREKEAISCLKEAVQVQRETGIVASFYLLGREILPLLKKIDQEVYLLVAQFHKENETSKVGIKKEEYLLTPKEREILSLVAEGRSNAEIGDQLYLTIGTVKWHMNHILGKLEVKNRIQAVSEARKLGEIT